MNRGLLTRIGEMLYGSGWQRAMANDLKVTDRTVRRWRDGQYKMGDEALAELETSMEMRRMDLGVLVRELRMEMASRRQGHLY